MPHNTIAASLGAWKMLGLSSVAIATGAQLPDGFLAECAKMPVTIASLLVAIISVIYYFRGMERLRITMEAQNALFAELAEASIASNKAQAEAMGALTGQIALLASKIQRVVYVKPGHREGDLEEFGGGG